MDRLKTLYPTSYLYASPGIGLTNQESMSLSIKEHQPSGKVKSLWKDGIIDWSSPIVPPKHPWDRYSTEPWTFSEVDALYADVLISSDSIAYYAYIKRPQGPITVIAKVVEHERWYAKYLRLLGRGSPSPILMVGKAVTCRVQACHGS
jgi:hypothetical protein